MDEGTAILIAALIGVMGTFVSYKLTANKKDSEWAKKFKPRPILPGQRKNTILLIGIGRVGKTQLVRYFTKSEPAAPKRITDKFAKTQSSKTYGNEQKITYYLSDYRGQNFSQLIKSFVEEQLKPDTPIRYGDINTLILMVDIVLKDEDPEHTKYPCFDKKRVQMHTEAWNMYALDAAFGLLTEESLELVILLINKIDKLENGFTEDVKANLEKAFSPLIENLKIRAKGSKAHFETIFCSAFHGTNLGGVNGLESKLNRYSVPREEKNKVK